MKLKKEVEKKETKKEVKKEIKEVKEEVKQEVKKIDVPKFYVLGSSESISDVAKKFGLKKEEIEKLNGSKVFFGGNQIKLK